MPTANRSHIAEEKSPISNWKPLLFGLLQSEQRSLPETRKT